MQPEAWGEIDTVSLGLKASGLSSLQTATFKKPLMEASGRLLAALMFNLFPNASVLA